MIPTQSQPPAYPPYRSPNHSSSLLQILLWLAVAVVLLALAVVVDGQELATALPDEPNPQTNFLDLIPHAPHPRTVTSYDYSIWASIGAAHAAEFELTEECIHSAICHEGVLPAFIWKHPAALAGTLAGFSVGQIEISRSLRRYHHRRLARAFDVANLVTFTGIDIYMGTLLNQRTSPATHSCPANTGICVAPR